ncbi:MAG: hypothetical protein HY697_03790 [Deltaproteobacteria bacterium]|nr:hypothetical protein [Deltaproteobacteria bacterium]
MKKICYACGRDLGELERISRQETCPFCRNDLHCCLNCGLFDEYAPHQCREPVAEWVSDREKNNFCEHFVFQETGAAGQKLKAQEESRAKLEAFFKKS